MLFVSCKRQRELTRLSLNYYCSESPKLHSFLMFQVEKIYYQGGFFYTSIIAKQKDKSTNIYI